MLFRSLLSCQDYNSLFKILKYKLTQKGLSPPVKVSSVNIFYACPVCGLNKKGNRFSSRIFICTGCGMTMDIEHLGSTNLGRKLIKYQNEVIKVRIETTSGKLKFINKDLGLEFCPSNPYDCADEFIEEVGNIINEFYKNINIESKDKG